MCISLKGKQFLLLAFSTRYLTPHNCTSLLSLELKKSRPKGPGPVLVYPCGFFYGASANKVGGVGFFLHLNELHSFEFALGAGLSTNTRAKLIWL